MFLALLAYLRVLTVSSNCISPGEMVAIITVLQLPPRLSFNIRVSLLSQYGTNDPFLFLSPRALMQLARANKLVLILAPSLSLMPVFSVAFPLSDPAKSMRLSLPVSTSDSVPAVRLFELTLI